MSTILSLVAFFFFVGVIYVTPWHKKIKINTRWKSLGVMILTAIVAAVMSPEPKADTATQSEVSTKPVSAKKEDATFKVGDSVKVGYLEYKVNKVTDSAKVKDPMGTVYKAGDGARYVLINISVKNNDKDEIMMTDELIKLIETDGTEYSADTGNSIWANKSGESFFLEAINPKMSKTSNVLYAVPNDVKLEDLLLEAQGGLLSGDKAKIKLK